MAKKYKTFRVSAEQVLCIRAMLGQTNPDEYTPMNVRKSLIRKFDGFGYPTEFDNNRQR